VGVVGGFAMAPPLLRTRPMQRLLLLACLVVGCGDNLHPAISDGSGKRR